ncbi:hypothetical protein PBY51_011415 [Eleginops maclovinus]|uniref:Uncharacterized protein n=1 Tax=Eleginops maclovinus TaxID=56733 RepID=A0AAN8ALA3_ELEMC|nr:hypothetical protein PBY51_011415 [Eleginops maclovinus]
MEDNLAIKDERCETKEKKVEDEEKDLEDRGKRGRAAGKGKQGGNITKRNGRRKSTKDLAGKPKCWEMEVRPMGMRVKHGGQPG